MTSAQHSIDTAAPPDALAMMLASHIAGAQAISNAIPQIAAAAALCADTLAAGDRLIYAAAGSSGLMALADGCELPGTFRIPQNQIRIHMAGGVPANGHMPGDTEDDTAEAAAIVADSAPGDLFIIVSASGTTPYALAVARAAQDAGRRTIGIANVASAPLLDQSLVAISVPTGREVVSGSTRLAAGTAQKIVLNMISTQAGALLGHVHDGLMVNVKPDNIKLRQRAADIVAEIANVDDASAQAALQAADYEVKPAVLVAAGAAPGRAAELLQTTGGRLRDSLAALTQDTNH